MKPQPVNLKSDLQSASCSCGSAGHEQATQGGDTLQAEAGRTSLVLHIPGMDCPAEESEIRRAVEHIDAIAGLRFDLSARTVRIDAPEDTQPTIVAAISKAGFASEPFTPGKPNGKGWGIIPRGIPVLAMALVLALGSELLAYLMPEVPLVKMAGMGLAAMAIVMAGFSTYRKGACGLIAGTPEYQCPDVRCGHRRLCYRSVA